MWKDSHLASDCSDIILYNDIYGPERIKVKAKKN